MLPISRRVHSRGLFVRNTIIAAMADSINGTLFFLLPNNQDAAIERKRGPLLSFSYIFVLNFIGVRSLSPASVYIMRT
jgi:hypothetical protein